MGTSILRVRVVVIGAWVLLASASRGQDAKPQLFLGNSATQPKKTPEPLLLRPNFGQQSLYAFATNPTTLTKNMIVEVRVNGEPVQGLNGTVAVPPGGEKQIMFKKVEPLKAAPADPNAKPTPPDPYAGWPELTRSTDKVEFRLMESDGMRLQDSVTISPEVMSPAQYVEVTSAYFVPATENGEKNYLTIKLRARRELAGPGCKVQLLLPPERIPKLKPGLAPGSIVEGVVTKEGPEVELIVKDIRFNDASSGEGLVFVSADDWPRVFVYRASFPAAGGRVPLHPVEGTKLRVASNRYYAPGPITFGIECDNPPPTLGLQTKVSLRQADNDREVTSKILPGAKDQRIRFNGAADGGLTFNASVQDWKVGFDVPEGDFRLQARVDSVESPVETITVADPTKFVGLQLDVPEKPIRGKKLRLTARCPTARLPIESVKFFVGARPEGDKIPPDFVLGTAQADKTTWVADLPVPDDKKVTTVSAQFINVLGKHDFKTSRVEFVDPPQDANTGSVKGKITNTNGDTQADTDVTLLSADKKETKGETKTNDKGEFEFADVMPGSYHIEAKRKKAQMSGNTSVKVEKGKVTDAPITIKRFGAK
jgi:hypothetical protein